MTIKIDPPIFFWTQKEYGFLSNFHVFPFEWEGKTWKTSEHAFQAMKTLDPVAQEDIRRAATPALSKKLGRAVVLRSDWEQVKYSIMREIVAAKFKNEPLRSKLIATGNADIYEDSPYDKIWGTGKLGSVGEGQNLLGDVLMSVRGKLKAELRKEWGKDVTVIPKGVYCYRGDYVCPYWDYVQAQGLKGTQNNGYCHYLERGDWDAYGVGLLWDQCKECGENEGWDEIEEENR